MAQLIQARNDSHIISPGHAPNAPLIQASAPPPIQYRVTGDDPNDRPDDRSVWNERTGHWERGTAAYANWRDELGAQRRNDEFSMRQRAEWDQLNDLTSKIMSSDRYTDAEKKKLMRQIDARRLGIQPLPQLPSEDENFDPKAHFEKYSYRDDAGNVWTYSPKTGSWSLGAGAPKPEKTTDATADAYKVNEDNYNAERLKIFAELMKTKKPMMDKDGKITGLGNDPMYTPEEAMAKAGEMARQAFPAMQYKTDAEKTAAEQAATAEQAAQEQSAVQNATVEAGQTPAPTPDQLAESARRGEEIRKNLQPISSEERAEMDRRYDSWVKQMNARLAKNKKPVTKETVQTEVQAEMDNRWGVK